MKKVKWTKIELLKNHRGSKKFDCYDRMEIAFVDLLLKENKELKEKLLACKWQGLE